MDRGSEMFEFIKNHQMNIMLCFCAVSAAMTVMLFLTKFLSKKRKWILISIETVATLLLFFDRLAYIYEDLIRLNMDSER